MPSLITIPYTIEQGKETGLVQLNVTPKPLILCALAAINPATKLVDSGSDVTYLTTTPALGGNTLTYNGNTYLARLQGNPIEQIQAQSPQGYDIPGSISLVIADGDFTIWTTHANAFGWRGGTLTVIFVLWDIPNNAYSTNAYTWTFILDKPTVDFGAGIIKVTGQARQSMTRLTVPNFARQNRCGWTFPGGTGATLAAAATAAAVARQDALTNPTSLYGGCVYSPDLISIGGVGNVGTPNLTNPDGSFLTDASGYYLMCDYTRSCGSGRATRTQGCMARLGNYAATTTFGSGGKPCGPDGDLANDSGNRATGHFTGDTWVSPQGWSGKQYVNPSAGTQYGFNAPNPPTGTTYYNQGYGTQWVNATVLEPFSGSNDLLAECIVCMAPFGPAKVLTVLVNGVEVPENAPAGNNFTYVVRSAGGRSGTVSQVPVLNGQGDTHGSTCWILITVPAELAGSGSIPTVQVLLQFPQCLHALPIATAVASGGNTILTLEAGVGNNFYAGVIAGQGTPGNGFTPYVAGNSGVPNGAYIPVSVTQTVSPTTGTITIPGAWNGTGGSIFYYPIAASDDGFSDVVPSAGATPTVAVAANPVWALMDLLACWGPFTVLDIDAASWYAAAQICAVQIGYFDINNNAATHARFRCSLALTTTQRQSLAKAVLAIRNCACIILARNPVNGLIQCFIEQTLADQQGAPIPGSNYNTAVASMPASSTTLVPSLTTPGYLAYLFDGGSATVLPSIEKGTFKLGGRTLNDTPNTIAFPFQDEANQFVQDTITTIDPDGYVTSGNQEIPASFAPLGIDNFDQGTRVSNIELGKALYCNTRFDAGGSELPSFRTTVKAAHLASRVGFICGITYAQAGLSMALARLLSATPNTDGEQWDLNFRLHLDAIHVDLYGQDPPPYQKNPLSAAPNRPPWPYQPNGSNWPFDDALFPGGSPTTPAIYTGPGQITVAGVQTVNVLSALTSAPRVPLQATIGSSGAIAAGNWLVSFVAIDSAGCKSQPSANVKAIVASGGATITVSNIAWDSNAVSAEIYFGPDSQHMTRVGFPLIASSITIGASSLVLSDTGLPDIVAYRYRFLVTPIRHGGIWGSAASAIAGAYPSTPSSITIPSAPTLDQWAGRILSLYGSATPVPFLGGAGTFAGLFYAQPANFNVTGNSTSGVMAISQETWGGAGHDPFTFPGDAYVMRAVANIASATTIGDTGFVNPFSAGGLGLIVDAEFGKIVWIMAGTGEGQRRNIASNTATTLTLSTPWSIIPDATSVFVVLETGASVTMDGAPFQNNGVVSSQAVLAVLNTPFTSQGTQSFLVQVVSEDVRGNISPVRFAPWQEVFVPSLTASSLPDGPVYAVPNVSNVFTPDLSQGLNQRVLLVADSIINTPINVPPGTSVTWTLIIDQDSAGGHNAQLPGYSFNSNILGTSLPGTRSQSNWITDQSGGTSLSGSPSTEQPIP
jgi:hypothetical protein